MIGTEITVENKLEKMTGGGQSSFSRKQEAIQALRGISCLLVILCHTDATHFGQTGVDVFLVISGYVIMRSTEMRKDHFLIRRIRKIVPLYWIMTVLTSILICIAPQLFRSYEVTFEYFIKSLLFIPYMHNGVSGPVLALGWTLNYEMLFYMIFYLSMRISWKYRGELAICICISLVAAGKLFALPMPFSYWCSDILMEFCYGMMLYRTTGYLFANKGETNTGKDKSEVWLVLFLLITFAGFSGMEIFLWIGIPRGVGTGIIASAIVWATLHVEKNVKVPRWLISIGNMSYLLYLIHIYPVRATETILASFSVSRIIAAIIAIIVSLLCGIMMDKVIFGMKHILGAIANGNKNADKE